MAQMFGKGRRRLNLQRSNEEQKEADDPRRSLWTDDTIEDSVNVLQSKISEAKNKGSVPVANEHWFNVVKPEIVVGILRKEISGISSDQNPTYIPDDIFESLAISTALTRF